MLYRTFFSTFLFCIITCIASGQTDSLSTDRVSVWTTSGFDLSNYFNRPWKDNGRRHASPRIEQIASIRVEYIPRQRWWGVSPEFYMGSRQAFVPYLRQDEIQYGLLNTLSFGIKAPATLHLLTRKGHGLRLSSGLFGETLLFPELFDVDNTDIGVRLKGVKDRFAYGNTSSIAFVFGNSFDVRLTQVFSFSTVRVTSTPNSDVSGSWAGRFTSWWLYFGLNLASFRRR
jgi:hypothetical protein